MIVLAGATGRTGRRVTESLRAKGGAVGPDIRKLAALSALGAELLLVMWKAFTLCEQHFPMLLRST